jgi:hypothetical protein
LENPAAIVLIQLRRTIAELQQNGYLEAGALPGAWKVVNWEGFNEMAQYKVLGG